MFSASLLMSLIKTPMILFLLDMCFNKDCPKLAALVDILLTHRKEKILVMSQFTEMILIEEQVCVFFTLFLSLLCVFKLKSFFLCLEVFKLNDDACVLFTNLFVSVCPRTQKIEISAYSSLSWIRKWTHRGSKRVSRERQPRQRQDDISRWQARRTFWACWHYNASDQAEVISSTLFAPLPLSPRWNSHRARIFTLSVLSSCVYFTPFKYICLTDGFARRDRLYQRLKTASFHYFLSISPTYALEWLNLPW